jgi:hypothetical protein
MTDESTEEAVSSDRDLRMILALIAIVLLFAGAARAASRRNRTQEPSGAAEAA